MLHRGVCRKAISCLLVGGLALAFAGGAAAQDESAVLYDQALDAWIERDARLQRIAQRIFLAGREICGEDVAPVLGAAAFDVEKGLPRALAAVAKERFGEDTRFVVTAVFEGGPAAEGGLRVGDVVLNRNGREVKSLVRLYANRRLRGEVAGYTVLRDGAEVTVEVPNRLGCAFPVWIAVSRMANASANGTSVRFTDAYLRLIQSDDTRAMVVGHEVAHNLLGHVRVRNVRDFWAMKRNERHADYYGIYLAALAGYAPKESEWLEFSRIQGTYGFERGLTHPTGHERDMAAKQTIDEIERKTAAGEPLRPEVE